MKNNQVIKNLLSGALLVIATFGFAIANYTEQSYFNASTIILLLLGAGAVAMLTKALRDGSDAGELGQG